MKNVLSAVAIAALFAAAMVSTASAQTDGERFGIGVFTYQNRTFVGLVMRYPTEPQAEGGVVVDLAAGARAAGQAVPTNDVLTIMDQWESGVNGRVREIVAQVGQLLDDNSRPNYVYDYNAMDVERPFLPRLALGGYSNYPGVIASDGLLDAEPPAPDMPGLWVRAADDMRPVNPRIFLVPSIDSVWIGDGDPVINWHPDIRQRYEYECEIAGVIGRPMWRVPAEDAEDYFFGYALNNDISDRQMRRPDTWTDLGTAMKGWDSFKPFGPFIVPKDFVDPTDVDVKMSLIDNDGVRHELQDGSTGRAYHSLYEYASYLSNMVTVPVGTVISLGTPPGSHGGLGRSMVPGDQQICSYTGLGTLHNTLVAEGSPEADAWVQKRNERLGVSR
jgi:2-keto-4-pentenoate hydratase/2-oxohepta-3-ene-1,7-dioic acid hydratase in catechol pathway